MKQTIEVKIERPIVNGELENVNTLSEEEIKNVEEFMESQISTFFTQAGIEEEYLNVSVKFESPGDSDED